jgi:hypothetical protein
MTVVSSGWIQTLLVSSAESHARAGTAASLVYGKS